MAQKLKFNITAEELYNLYVEDQLSTVQIAKLYGLIKTDGKPNAAIIYRALERYNIPIRNKSVSAKLSLASGVSQHPTEGRQRTVQERINIGVALKNEYNNDTEEGKARRVKGLREFWDGTSNIKAQEEAIRKRGQQIQKAIKEGTYIEKVLATNLISWGYSVKLHSSEGFLTGTGLEADMIITGHGINVCLEVDGPRHWGDFMNRTPLDLAKTIQADNKKNGLVLRLSNVFMLRILWPFGSRAVHAKATLERVYQVLKYFKSIPKKDNFKLNDRIIQLDMGLIVDGKACTDNSLYRDAMEILKAG